MARDDPTRWGAIGARSDLRGEVQRLGLIAVVAALLVVIAAPAAIGAPADGNGNKFVVEIEDFGSPVDCTGYTVPDLWRAEVGFIQFREFQGEGNRNLELNTFHLDVTFTNAEGDTRVWRDRGPITSSSTKTESCF